MTDHLDVAAAEDCPPGRSLVVSFDGEAVAVFNVRGAWFAVSDTCPHAGASLALGTVRAPSRREGPRVLCPRHDAAFDLATGEVREGPSLRGLSCYRVKIVDGRIHLTRA